MLDLDADEERELLVALDEIAEHATAVPEDVAALCEALRSSLGG